MKLWEIDDQALTGAVINLATGGFQQGHNLHHLRTTGNAKLTIPVFPTGR